MHQYINKKIIRKNFSKHNQIINLSNLLDIQKVSFNKFIMFNENRISGIDNVFKSIFPIFNYNKNAKLEYISYYLKKNNINSEECNNKGLTYSSSLKVKLKLTIYDKNSEPNTKHEIEQEVYMGEIPIMTDSSSFIINGVEKVIVSQLHRSPGVFFDIIKDKLNIFGKNLYSARIIPYRGSWLDFEFDSKDNLFSRIDRKKKFPITVFFHAFNYSNEKIINTFCKRFILEISETCLYIDILKNNLKNKVLDIDISLNSYFIIEKNTKINDYHINELIKNKIYLIKIETNFIIGKVSAKDYLDKNGNIILNSNQVITLNIFNRIKENNYENIEIIDFNNSNYSLYICKSLKIDNTYDYKSAIIEIYKIIRPGDLPSFETAEYLFKSLFFLKEKYDLSEIGRMKINQSINNNFNNNTNILNEFDFIEIIKKLIDIKHGNGNIDDIDNLGNRRIKSVGEMIENQFRLGLLRVEKSIKDRLSIGDILNLTPQKIISSKQLSSSIREFFNSSQLSQFMDQNNPLAEITHKRRISALGPGGLTRDRAGFEVRDVHPTHYGKLCPIETPEGPNIGLINSLAIYAKINKYGFLETPYQVVENNFVTNKIHYLSSTEEFNFVIAQANTKIDLNNKFIDENIICRNKGEFSLFKSNLINYIDVSNQQIVSIGASLIPFLEHNDANRALMGANMQRQAVPLINPESPIVGTGMEYKIAVDSKSIILAKRSGKVVYLDSNYIIVKANENEINYHDKDNGLNVYKLRKFYKSNQNTCINYTPCINLNDDIKKDQILSDSQSTKFGELSLGKNIKVAFMSWYGYNFEDSMIISERLVKDDVFTSIHIQELICISRDTKLGSEEITSDIPNVSESSLSKLDENGIAYIGSYVNQGDILVGKVTPKGETQLTPEEKLLRAIFGEKASDVKDSSLRVPNGVSGTVIDVEIFTKEGIKKDNRTLLIEKNKLEKIKKELYKEKEISKLILLNKIKEICNASDISFNINLNKINKDIIINKFNKNNILLKNIENLIDKYNKLDIEFENRINSYKLKINSFYNLSPGILKIVKVYLATKKYIQPGDKMAGRHGNKGVISKINPIEDMPFDKNGEIIDIILNPLGVPSRMNIGQILEAHVGFASKEIGKNIQKMIDQKLDIEKLRSNLDYIYNNDIILNSKKIDFNKFEDNDIYALIENLKNGIKISTPVFDGINEKEIKNMLKMSNIDTTGQIDLFDGFNGEKFDRKITVGYIYMMKLNHLVDDKMHARSTGSYSLITQQPLGGKAQFGGQRFGEMEVWALEAYGASYALQEMLTVKSDDVEGRINMYKNIIHGNSNIEVSIPESFNVLIKEIRSLCINIELNKK